MDEHEARDRVRPLGNVERLVPGEAEVITIYERELNWAAQEPLASRKAPAEGEIDVWELRMIEAELRARGDCLANRIHRALGGAR